MMNSTLRPSALLRRKFSMICGENTTTQQAVVVRSVSRVEDAVHTNGNRPANPTDGLDIQRVALWRRKHSCRWSIKFLAGPEAVPDDE